MECIQHPGTNATARCLACARPFCVDCLEDVNGQHHCHACASRIRQGLPPGLPQDPGVASPGLTSPAVQTPVTSRLAVAALVLGLSAVLCGVTAIPAVICGIIALVKISNSQGRLSGIGLAVGGIVAGGLFFLVAPMFAAILIPNLLRSRMQANESAAIGNLRMIVGAEEAYHDANGKYADSFEDLANATPAYLDGIWTLPKNGYLFTLNGTDNSYSANADPEMFGNSGNRGFFVDETGVIRYSVGEPASQESTPIGQ